MVLAGAGDEWDESGSSAELTHADLLEQVAVLERRLASMAVIEQAKGALMITCGLTDGAAFAVLRRHSQHGNVKVRDIAAELTGNAPRNSLGEAATGQLNRLLQTVTDDLRATRHGASAHRPLHAVPTHQDHPEDEARP